MPRFSVINLDAERVFLKDEYHRTLELPLFLFNEPPSPGEDVLVEAVRHPDHGPLPQPLARAVLNELLQPPSPTL